MNSWEMLPDVAAKLGLAIVLSSVVGIERERKGRAAGLRTHVLVCLGATLLMIVADVFARQWNSQDITGYFDRGRMAAGIITGIGFLGAGTIINVGGAQRGLTTAAMVWFVAALGIAVGSGLYLIAVGATALALVVVLLFEYLERLLPSGGRFRLSLRIAHGLEQLDAIEKTLRDEGFLLKASRIEVSEMGEREIALTFDIVSNIRPNLEKLVNTLDERFPSAKNIVLER